MPICQDNHHFIRFSDALPGLSASKLLTNEGQFHVSVSPNYQGELFAVGAPAYQLVLCVHGGTVIFQRNEALAQKQIGQVRQRYQILISWRPDRIQLALIVDGQVGGDDACITVDVPPTFVPLELGRWAQRQNLLPQASYSSAAELLATVIEGIQQVQSKIHAAGCVASFWDRQGGDNEGSKRKPKLEPEAVSLIRGFLYDYSLLAGYELSHEVGAAGGSLDMKVTAPSSNGGLIKICIECKNSHSDDIFHGLTDQLPAYMRSLGADYGIYLVLWYKGKYLDRPTVDHGDLKLELTKRKPLQNIIVDSIDLSWPLAPSDRGFRF